MAQETRTFSFVVKITVPVDTGADEDAPIRDATASEARRYVREAVECWGGQFHPDDPFFARNGMKVAVTPTKYDPAQLRRALGFALAQTWFREDDQDSKGLDKVEALFGFKLSDPETRNRFSVWEG